MVVVLYSCRTMTLFLVFTKYFTKTIVFFFIYKSFFMKSFSCRLFQTGFIFQIAGSNSKFRVSFAPTFSYWEKDL